MVVSWSSQGKGMTPRSVMCKSNSRKGRGELLKLVGRPYLG